jgi:hypothetical protein
MDEKQRCGLAQFPDRREHSGHLPARVEDMIRQRILVRHLLGVGQRNRDALLPPQDKKT